MGIVLPSEHILLIYNIIRSQTHLDLDLRIFDFLNNSVY
jgi:hypothetical protein